MAVLPEPLAVATCIACGARSRAGACPDGCDDLPLDLVELADLERLQAAVAAARARTDALLAVVREIAAGGSPDRDRARAALRLPAPDPGPPGIVEAWGCPRCGRIDAPRPCLGVCVRTPVVMIDASRLHEPAAELAALRAAEAHAAPVARLAATIRPRPGHEAETQAALRERARRAQMEPA